MEPNELYHYGILGMKWGVRRTPEQLGHKTTSNNKKKKLFGTAKSASKDKETDKVSEDKKKTPLIAAQNISKDLGKVVKIMEQHQAQSVSKQKGQLRANQRREASKMTNEELQKVIQRMSLEDQYANLTSARMSVGKSYTDEILSGVGEGLAIVGSIFSILTSAKILIGK